uniref:Acetyl-CoA carboxylase-like n=1 Tax=Dermatophagoides pteronyssinus TaxID=6956 RepID=A0A6P6YBT3_DERPT|nr:acetyl-CoA carboxylase-like [Dermatophagoides pteronyssinus]
MTTDQLLYFARSHQALKRKNILILSLLNIISSKPILLSLFDPLEHSVRQLSNLSKIEYSEVTDATRTLLLCVREGVPFDQHTIEVMARLKAVIEYGNSGATSPFTSMHHLFRDPESMQFDMAHLPNYNEYNNEVSTFKELLKIIQPTLDITQYSTEALLFAICNGDREISELAIKLVLLRVNGFRWQILKSLNIKFQDDVWNICDEETKSKHTYKQEKNSVIVRWMSPPIISYEWLQRSNDCLRPDNQCANESEVGFKETSISSGHSTYVNRGAKFYHMINDFSVVTDAEYDIDMLYNTLAIVITNPDNISVSLREKLTELMEIELLYAVSIKPRGVRNLFILFINLEFSIDNFVDLLNENADTLARININLVYLTHLANHPSDNTSPAKNSFITGLPKVAPVLNHYYYRNIKEIPYANTAPFHKNYFVEEKLLRHCELPLIQNLELRRMRLYNICKLPCMYPNIHVYEAVPKAKTDETPRFLLRLITNINSAITSDIGLYEVEKLIVNGLNHLELLMREKKNASNNHILLSVNYIKVNDVLCGNSGNKEFEQLNKLTPQLAEQIVRDFYNKYSQRIKKFKCNTIEVRFKTKIIDADKRYKPVNLTDGSYPCRVILHIGETVKTERYVELQNPSTGEHIFAALYSGDTVSTLFLKSNTNKSVPIDNKSATHMKCVTDYYNREDLDGKSVDTPHSWNGELEAKREIAKNVNTFYVYDFIDLLESAMQESWKKCPKHSFTTDHQYPSDNNPTLLLPEKLIEVVELILNNNQQLVESSRCPGYNTCGMVAWKMLLRTPEFPKGRRIIVIANDITYQLGTFGVEEDLLFLKASELARELGIPRIYIAVNSGARIGLSENLINVFLVEWIDKNKPQLGCKYIYLKDEDYIKVGGKNCVKAEKVVNSDGEEVWKINDIIDTSSNLGVENLMGSAMIAGETVRNCKNNFTLTFVTGRSVGIGAYLARLGQRVIQKDCVAPIILTGFQALNRILAKQAYSSNDELGGTRVMANNGVTHQVVSNDLEGCIAILKWLSFVPEHINGPLPILIHPGDPINRPVRYTPSSLTNDPRYLLTGCTDSKGFWLSGILDKGSFIETLERYGKSVIAGRGRIGGLPLGVICVETRVTYNCIPADPALPYSVEEKYPRAGQVWFPESAYKTAQCIYDFNKEELPLLILANWRGFSGGQHDMYHEILKFGSMIVDALVEYKQPCIIYIPPKGELRGGAWVVIDSRINPDYMEMYADTDSRAGVIETTGLIEIKYREKRLRELASRVDEKYTNTSNELKKLLASGVSRNDKHIKELEEKLDKRFEILAPVMRQIALHFADLHDTPERMKATNAIKEVIPWNNCRQILYWKIRSKLIQDNLRDEIIKQDPRITLQEAQEIIKSWVSNDGTNIENPQELRYGYKLLERKHQSRCFSVAFA